MKLYGYCRSSAAYRVRIACNLKQVDYETVAARLVRGGGEQFDPSYLRLNPQGQVPALGDGAAVITQSMAIIEYLEEIHPEPPLLFATPVVAGDFEDAVAAYVAGKYEDSYRLLKPLVEQGDAVAQYNLGVMYAHGEGVSEDDAQAVHWYRKAAEQGVARAQVNLG